MKPEKAPIVNYEGMYTAVFNGEPLMHIRARKAAHAEAKLMYCFRRELSGKTLDFDLEAFTEGGQLEDMEAEEGADSEAGVAAEAEANRN